MTLRTHRDKLTESQLGVIEVKQVGVQMVRACARDATTRKAVNLRWVKLTK